jgi:hypothetical protein
MDIDVGIYLQFGVSIQIFLLMAKDGAELAKKKWSN